MYITSQSTTEISTRLLQLGISLEEARKNPEKTAKKINAKVDEHYCDKEIILEFVKCIDVYIHNMDSVIQYQKEISNRRKK